MSLLFDDLQSWQSWADSRRRAEGLVRRVKGSVKPSAGEVHRLHLPSDEARTLVVIDQLKASTVPCIWEPLRHLDARHTAVVAPPDVELPAEMTPATVEDFTGVERLPATINSVLSLGAYLPVSAQVNDWAATRGIRFIIVQHGLLTPWAPPAPRGAHVLAWADGDVDMWRSTDNGVTADAVGAQLFWNARSAPAAPTTSERPVMLGQLHGVELPRRDTFSTYVDFARRVPSDYRPHPTENDAVSRALHAVMKRRGVTFDTTPGSLIDLGRPVVSIFSTGTLEAAMRGLPAWVTHPSPPEWVAQFWQRYGLAQWGDEPTRAWSMPDVEPALAVARALESA